MFVTFIDRISLYKNCKKRGGIFFLMKIYYKSNNLPLLFDYNFQQINNLHSFIQWRNIRFATDTWRGFFTVYVLRFTVNFDTRSWDVLQHIRKFAVFSIPNSTRPRPFCSRLFPLSNNVHPKLRYGHTRR